MYNGYEFYFKVGEDVLTLPITPAELKIKVGSKNQVVTLINEGDINILKSPSLTEIEFEARFPMRQYPYARKLVNFKTYWKTFKKLKEEKKSFRFIVARYHDLVVVISDSTKSTKKPKAWDTNLLVALEEIELKESADEGDDVIVSFKLKQYKEYGTKKYKPNKGKSNSKSTSTSKKSRSDEGKSKKSKTHTVKSGDCLWNIAKKYYDNGAKWKKIYNANKSLIEKTAKKYGKQSSSNGHWIYPGTKLTIPAL